MQTMVVEPGHVRIYPITDETGLWQTWYIVGDREYMEGDAEFIKRMFEPRPYLEPPTVLQPFHDYTEYVDCNEMPPAHHWLADLTNGDEDDVLRVIEMFQAAAFVL